MKKNRIVSCLIPFVTMVGVYSSQAHAVYNGVEVIPQEESYMVYLEGGRSYVQWRADCSKYSSDSCTLYFR